MKKIIFLLIVLFQSAVFAQFKNIIFQKDISVQIPNGIFALGDVNNDGFNDFAFLECKERKAYVFWGGKTLSTTPGMIITPDNDVRYINSILSLDVNGDKINDIIISYLTSAPPLYEIIGHIKIYYGGKNIDTIPDFILNRPEGASKKTFGQFLYRLKNFDGINKDVLIIGDYAAPFAAGDWEQYGCLYFYKTKPVLDTIPFLKIYGDKTIEKKLIPELTFGDINGDGLTDICLYATYGSKPPLDTYCDFILGNTEWNMTPKVRFRQIEHSFDVGTMGIIEDINNDGKDDIIMNNYGKYYPDWYTRFILYGSYPIDTIPKVGINTQYGIGGTNFRCPGDVNGDGYKDLILCGGPGAPSIVKILMGCNDTVWYPVAQLGGTDEGFGEGCGGVGDVNGDGVNDICIVQQHSDCSGIDPKFAVIIKGDTSVKANITGIKPETNRFVPGTYELYDPYPNPFNPEVCVSYKTGQNSFVTIKLYNVLGREITELVNEEKPEGNYQIEINTKKYNLSSGVYFVEMSAISKGSSVFHKSKKLLLTK